MKTSLWILLLSLLAAAGQDNPYQRQFFSTNTDPVVEATAGSNCFITYSQAGQTRTFKIDVPQLGAGTSNVFLINTNLSYDTNLGICQGNTQGFYFTTITGLTSTNYFRNLVTLAGLSMYTNGDSVLVSNSAPDQLVINSNRGPIEVDGYTQAVFYGTLGGTNYYNMVIGGPQYGVMVYTNPVGLVLSNTFPAYWWTNTQPRMHQSLSYNGVMPTNEVAFGSISNNYNVGIRGLLALYGSDTNTVAITTPPYFTQYYTIPFIEFRVAGRNAGNTYVGRNAGTMASNGYANTFVGFAAGSNNLNGRLNTYVGVNAGLVNQNGDENVAVGSATLASANDANATRNVAVGSSALTHNTIGGYNTAVGYYALQGNTSGHHNVAIGHETISGDQIGIQNIAIGSSALISGYGSNNIAIGRTSMQGAVGSDNIAIGQDTLLSSGTSLLRSNIVIGPEAARTLIQGSDNVIIGSWAGYALQYGSNNVFIGDNVRTVIDGSYVTTYNASSNILIGTGGFTKARYNRTNSWFFEEQASTRYNLMATQAVHIGYQTMSPVVYYSVTNSLSHYTQYYAPTNIQFTLLVPTNITWMVTNGLGTLDSSNFYTTTGSALMNVPLTVDNSVTVSNGVRLAVQNGGVASVAGLGILWNSNKVLYWVTDAQTNLVSDGR